jgi:hypothetical protein
MWQMLFMSRSARRRLLGGILATPRAMRSGANGPIDEPRTLMICHPRQYPAYIHVPRAMPMASAFPEADAYPASRSA